MRILWISHLVPFPPLGGVQQRSYHLIREAAREHELHLVALNQEATLARGDLPAAIRHMEGFCAGVTVFEIPADRSRLRWWWLVASSFVRPTPYSVNWLRSRPMQARVGELRRAQPTFDLVHVDTLGVAPYGFALAGMPVVLNHHNVESWMMSRRVSLEENPLKRLYFRREAEKLRRFEKGVCSRAAVNLVVSDPEGRRLREVAGPVPLAVVENGVDVEYFRPGGPLGHGRDGLVFVGGMSWYPNRDAVRFLIREIWPLLAADGSGRRLTVVGRDAPPELLDAARTDPRVEAPGFVEDARPLVDRALAYVCPIRDGGGTRLKILDALAMGKPLVATGFAVNGLGLEEEVHYLRAEAPADYVRQVARLEADGGLRATLAAEGRRHVVESFSWSVVGRHLRRAFGRAYASREGRSPQPSS